MSANTRTKRPNVILVLTDDQGYGDLGCHGNPWLQTPNIDMFHRDSVRFTNYHVGPTCAPTRSGLLTGHYANSTGVWHTIGGRSLLRKDEWTLASALGEAGYDTAIFGKWHLGDDYPYRPSDRGFKTAVVHGGGGVSQTPDYWGNDYFDDTYFVNGEPREFDGYCTDVFFEQALAYIRDHRDKPFFAYIATNAPHAPFNVPARYFDLYSRYDEIPDSRRRFYGMITNIDENFGRLRSVLAELEIEENTILMFMTDNGSSNGVDLDSDGFATGGFNAGMRGQKGSEYDGGHRVPWFVRWPSAGIGGGRDRDELTANIDFMPTVMELCGLDADGHTFHGRSLAGLLDSSGAVDWEDRVVVTDSQRVVRPIKWKQSSVMNGSWRLVNGAELFDVDTDPEQRDDVSHRHPDLVTALRVEYERWWKIVGEQFDTTVPISVGQDDDVVTLTSHDIRNEECQAAWNQGLIRRAAAAVGYWELLVERSGTYRIELRRWPREIDLPLRSGPGVPDINWNTQEVEPRFAFWYEGGVAVDIVRASVEIQGTSADQEVSNDSRAAIFELDLEKGETELKTLFTCADGKENSAFYAYVTRIPG